MNHKQTNERIIKDKKQTKKTKDNKQTNVGLPPRLPRRVAAVEFSAGRALVPRAATASSPLAVSLRCLWETPSSAQSAATRRQGSPGVTESDGETVTASEKSWRCQ